MNNKSNLMRVKASELAKRTKIVPAPTSKRPCPQVGAQGNLLKQWQPKRLQAIVNGK